MIRFNREVAVMSMIFPGMDPWLENPRIWPEVHHRLIVYIADALQPKLLPRYVAKIESRVYLEEANREVVPDVIVRRERAKKPAKRGAVAVAVRKTSEADRPILVQDDAREIEEPYLTIRDLKSHQKVVTVVEVVSPSNKDSGPGRESYESKQREVLRADANLVEIDLLRGGRHVVAASERCVKGYCGEIDYLICVHRSGDGERFALYPLNVRDRLPTISLPLAKGDEDVTVELRNLLEKAYESGAYRQILNYDRPCRPALLPGDQEWAAKLIKKSKRSRI